MIIGIQPIPNHPEYMADIDGSIWSSKRGEWRKMAPCRKVKDGRANYKLSTNGKLSQHTGAYLILITFVGPRPDGMLACHKDDNCFNDALYNLKWDTPENNVLDRVNRGGYPIGEKHPNVKISDEDIKEIRRLRALGESFEDIADIYDVAHEHIAKICRGYR